MSFIGKSTSVLGIGSKRSPSISPLHEIEPMDEDPMFEVYSNSSDPRFDQFLSFHTQWIQDGVLVNPSEAVLDRAPQLSKVQCIIMITCQMLLCFNENGEVLRAIVLAKIRSIRYCLSSRTRKTTVLVQLQGEHDMVFQYISACPGSQTKLASEINLQPRPDKNRKDIVTLLEAITAGMAKIQLSGGKKIVAIEEQDERKLYAFGEYAPSAAYTPPEPVPEPLTCVCWKQSTPNLSRNNTHDGKSSRVSTASAVPSAKSPGTASKMTEKSTPSSDSAGRNPAVSSAVIKSSISSQTPAAMMQAFPYLSSDNYVLRFDRTAAACASYGVFSGERLASISSKKRIFCTVIGIHERRLWVHVDHAVGACVMCTADDISGTSDVRGKRSVPSSSCGPLLLEPPLIRGLPLQCGWTVHGLIHVRPVRFILYRTNMGFSLRFDISDALCRGFGFLHGARVQSDAKRGQYSATIIGVHENELWFHIDGDAGAVHAHGMTKKEDFVQDLGWSDTGRCEPVICETADKDPMEDDRPDSMQWKL